MLKYLVSGIHQSNAVIIEDSLSYSGSNLWKAFIQQMSISGKHVIHVLYFENPIETILNCESSDLLLHDCFSDPRGWINGGNEDCSLLETVKRVVGRNDGDIIVAIDSLSPLLFSYGFAQCYRDLHTLVSRPLFPDFLPERESSVLRLQHLASTYIQVEPPLRGSLGYPVVRITHKKPGGKVIRKIEQFYFDGEGHVTSSDVQHLPDIPVPAVVDSVNSMDELTTFKLGLHEEEIRARSQLVLPYLKCGEKAGGEGGGGQVFYQPDAADDWDEEDPDDDLDV
ncbi:elongator complex protein 5 isoform X2 [Anabrus simplex]|uniref:elongator complex protein 5 isoform X2 n=1 Tax=Anabrus simplex TaxID=316456 RepID=UPI0034DD14DA